MRPRSNGIDERKMAAGVEAAEGSRQDRRCCWYSISYGIGSAERHEGSLDHGSNGRPDPVNSHVALVGVLTRRQSRSRVHARSRPDAFELKSSSVHNRASRCFVSGRPTTTLSPTADQVKMHAILVEGRSAQWMPDLVPP